MTCELVSSNLANDSGSWAPSYLTHIKKDYRFFWGDQWFIAATDNEPVVSTLVLAGTL